MTADKTSEDNPMRYKRRSRRVSLMTSEGAAIFQFDVPNSDSSAANNSTTTTLTNNNIIASAPPSSGEQSRPQFSQFVQGSSDVSIDPPETVGPSSGLIVNRRGRRSSLSEIVEQENIKAGQENVFGHNEMIWLSILATSQAFAEIIFDVMMIVYLI